MLPQVLCPLLALNGHSNRAHVCPLLDQSGQTWILAYDGPLLTHHVILRRDFGATQHGQSAVTPTFCRLGRYLRIKISSAIIFELRGARSPYVTSSATINSTPRCAVGRRAQHIDTPAFQPYWGKLTVRNDRGDRGNVGIIRSLVRAKTQANMSHTPGGRKIVLHLEPAPNLW